MRFKGLGEMQPEELKRTTLDPATRRFLRVTVVDGAETDRVLTELMGKDVEARFKFIMERAAQADLSIFFPPPRARRGGAPPPQTPTPNLPVPPFRPRP